MRHRLIEAGFGVMGAMRLHRLAAPLTRGLGAILTFHHVRPPRRRDFEPNRLLEITPEFLDAVIGRLGASGYAIVSLDEALRRIEHPDPRRPPFAALTFDDGFRDNRDWALPVLERHGVPAVFYVTTGFADRTARLWWVELEEAIRRTERVVVEIGGERLDLPARTAQDKRAAFAAIYWKLRRQPEECLLQVIGDLCATSAVNGRDLVDELCLDWPAIERMATHPLVTIGAHTKSHVMLAKHSEACVSNELVDARSILEQRLGRPVRHLAYPVGDRTSAAAREFRLARLAGYASAVTTRPGLIFPAHAQHLTALPRVSVNGNHQTLTRLDILLSGAAFTLWNRGRRVDAA
jgi:peptidoglycan/xylan/chitin deacetylase (PgdA/CDA1 family)